MTKKILIDFLPMFGTISFWKAVKKSNTFVVLDREIVPAGWNNHYVSIPLNSEISSVEFEDIRINNNVSSWQNKIWKIIDDKYHRDKYFRLYKDRLKKVFCGRYYIRLFNFYNDLFVLLCEFLDINVPVILQSYLPFFHKLFTDRLVNIARYNHATEILLPYYFEQEVQKIKFVWAGQTISFYDKNLTDILDVLFKYGEEAGEIL